MPPKKRQQAGQTAPITRRSTRQRTRPEDTVPDVYREMLAEVAEEEKASATRLTTSRRRAGEAAPRPVPRRRRGDEAEGLNSEGDAQGQIAGSPPRPSKRRKTSEEPSNKIELEFDLFDGEGTPACDTSSQAADTTGSALQQITLTEFDTASESEADFEDVDLEPAPEEIDYDDKPEQTPLQLDLSSVSTPKRAAPKRKPVSAAERRLRLAVHKAHTVLFLAHLKCRNRWCNSESMHAILKSLVPRKLITLLHVDEGKTQYERNQSFTKGIEELCTLWRTSWTLDGRGMTRAYWREDVDAVKESDDAEDVEFDDFKLAAVSKQGSRDLAAQLFCALLRSVAIDARLVCSMQVLPFSGGAKGQTPQKPATDYIYAPPQEYNSTSGTVKGRKPAYQESQFPIFWVEVFAPAIQKWIPLDPIVRYTINKPKTGFEPFANDVANRMTYVIAFEDDGSAKDVTIRYTQFFNSKVRKQRVESTQGGDRWWESTMSTLEKPFREVRDDIEDAFLEKRSESEAMPNNIQDFKGHPVYVIERHLRKNEVIQPRREVGKVSIGIAAIAKLVPVFRRRDVHICRTADAWYRRGRDVNEGEQPLKRVATKAAPAVDDFNDDEDATDGTALYAEFQTSLYVPPPIVEGRVPKNAYGNLDVYVPSMIPPGAVHVRHPLASKAARILGIDHTDAVTGFQFKGRQGTAVVDGVVVSMDMTNAMIHVIEGLESEATEEAQAARSQIILAIWKRWLAALRIKEHVKQQYGDREEAAVNMFADDESEDEDHDTTFRPEDDGGGFMLDGEQPDDSGQESPARLVPSSVPDLRPLELPTEAVHQAVVVIRSPHKLPHIPAQTISERDKSDMKTLLPPAGADDHASMARNEGGGPIAEEAETGGGFFAEDEDGDGGGFVPEEEDAASGGFVPEDEDAEGGGFLPEGDETVTSAKTSKAHELHKTEDPDGIVPETIGASNHKPPQDEIKKAIGTGNSAANLPINADITHLRIPPTQKPAAEGGSPAASASPGSLLSHDPDEDDAEPDWLVNSLGEIE